MKGGDLGMNKLSTMDWVTFVLVIIGGINWGLVGALDFNLVDAIFGVGSAIATIIYVLVGLSAIYWLFMMGKLCKK
jgi:uncharacterized membrane protein YuzA (DUF378 family)